MTKTTRFSGPALGIGLFSLLVAGQTSAYANPIPIGDGGILSISGAVGTEMSLNTVTPCFNWGGGSTCAGATHSMNVSGASMDFSTAASSTDTIKDLSGFGPVSDFETILGGTAVGGATVHFDLTSIVVNGGVASGDCTSNNPSNSCTPANSPLNLIENSTGVSISFVALLNAYTGTSGTGVTPYVATFSTQLVGTLNGTGACHGIAANLANVASCEGAGGTIDTTWSATEPPAPATAPVPEPATLTLTGLGFAAVARFRRRFRSA
jgi:hypothetical protein